MEKAKIVAILKSEKVPPSHKSYRPISLLCCLCKLYEHLIMTPILSTVDNQLSHDQAGFRPGHSCSGQVLNLTQYINGFEKQLKTEAVFVDLTTAYDTVNHRALLLKVAKLVKHLTVVLVIESILNNRRFFVEMNSKKAGGATKKRIATDIGVGFNVIQHLHQCPAAIPEYP